jgi:hypothetical protein
MSCTLGQAAKVVGMSKTSIMRSIKAGRISAGRNEFGQWAIEPCELHRVYPPLTDDTGTGNGTEERAVTGGETAVAQANARAARRSLSHGGDGCEPRRATSSFYGLWASCVGEFCWSP